MIRILGDAPSIKRLITGLYSFDRAFVNSKGDLGMPIGIGYEIFGPNHVGKSTVAYGLAGIIAKELNSGIVLADFEGFDPEFLLSVLGTSKFDGDIQRVLEENDEDTLDNLIVFLRKGSYCVGILDSIGAISPISEQQGELGETNMGRRAFILAQFTRKMLKLLRKPEHSKTLLMINHAYPIIGGRGLQTPGGEVKKYLAAIRIQVKRKYWKGKYEEFPDGSYIIEGKVIKNRFGIKDRNFNLFVLSGKGIHNGLTAMYDCVMNKLVERGKTVQLNGKSFGYLRNLIDEAQSGNEEFFKPFHEALENYDGTEDIIPGNEEPQPEDEDTGTEGGVTDPISEE